MQAFDAVLANFGAQWLTPILGIMLVAASLGGMLTWLAGPSKGLLLISRQEGYLPPFLQRLNKNGVQQNILVTQGLVTTVIALGYALIPNVSSAYWIFSVITTQVYLIMYLLMFVAAARLRRRHPDHPRGYRAPMLIGLCGVGFAASLAALLIGFVPPSQFGEGNLGLYLLIVAGGALGLGLLVPYLFYRARKPSWKTAGAEEVPVGMSSSMFTPDRTQAHHLRRDRGDPSWADGHRVDRLLLGKVDGGSRGQGRRVHRLNRRGRSADAVEGPGGPGAGRRRRGGLQDPEQCSEEGCPARAAH